jgi:hypothetical protein
MNSLMRVLLDLKKRSSVEAAREAEIRALMPVERLLSTELGASACGTRAFFCRRFAETVAWLDGVVEAEVDVSSVWGDVHVISKEFETGVVEVCLFHDHALVVDCRDVVEEVVC